MKNKFLIKKTCTYLFYVMLMAAFYGCEHPERAAWNWNDKPKAICDTTLPKGVIIETSWSGGNLIVVLNSNGKITKWVKDENLKTRYLVNDTIKYCH